MLQPTYNGLELPIWNEPSSRLCVSTKDLGKASKEEGVTHLVRTVKIEPPLGATSLKAVLDLTEQHFRILAEQGLSVAKHKWVLVPEDRVATELFKQAGNAAVRHHDLLPPNYILGAQVEIIGSPQIDPVNGLQAHNLMKKYQHELNSARAPYLRDLGVHQTVLGIPATAADDIATPTRYLVDIEPRFSFYPIEAVA